MPVSKHTRNGKRRVLTNQLFLSERILANSSVEVQELLQSANSKNSYNEITTKIKTKIPYMKISDAKTKKQSVIFYPLYKLPTKRRAK